VRRDPRAPLGVPSAAALQSALQRQELGCVRAYQDGIDEGEALRDRVRAGCRIGQADGISASQDALLQQGIQIAARAITGSASVSSCCLI
jgi:hypothetical protein